MRSDYLNGSESRYLDKEKQIRHLELKYLHGLKP